MSDEAVVSLGTGRSRMGTAHEPSCARLGEGGNPVCRLMTDKLTQQSGHPFWLR